MVSCEQTLEAREIVGGTGVVWVGAWDEDVWGFGDVGMYGGSTEFEEQGSFVKAAGKGCGGGGRRI